MQELSKILETSLGGYSLSRILSAVLTMLVCLIVSRLLLKLAKRLLDRSKKLTARLRQIVLTSAKVVLYLLTGIITAEALGLNTSSLTALVSVLTLGVTLAAEDILGNVAGGLVILTSHPFNIGDDIEVADTAGTVREITLNHTKIETPDGQFVMQPNKELSSSRIINYTAMGRRRVVRDRDGLLRRAHRDGEGRLSGGGGGHAQCAAGACAGGVFDGVRQQRH